MKRQVVFDIGEATANLIPAKVVTGETPLYHRLKPVVIVVQPHSGLGVCLKVEAILIGYRSKDSVLASVARRA